MREASKAGLRVEITFPILLKGPTGHSTGVLGDGLEDPMGNYQVADLVGMDAVVVD